MIQTLLSSMVAIIFMLPALCTAQIVINEGSNKNYNTLLDEDSEGSDWIELYNSGSEPINLLGYTLSDSPQQPAMWTFPSQLLDAGQYLTVFCSSKNRFYSPSYQQVVFEEAFTSPVGWSTHNFDTPFVWDGFSNIAINTCSYNQEGYTINASFRQSIMPFESSTFYFEDYGNGACSKTFGFTSNVRPNMLINGVQIGTGTYINDPYTYPAPYGNWYFSARHQFLILAEELIAAGLSAGEITSLAFDVVSAGDVQYEYFELSISTVGITSLTQQFLNTNGSLYHTNFGISSGGEQVSLYSPQGSLVSSLLVDAPAVGTSVGLFPDGQLPVNTFATPTPSASNGPIALGQLFSPVISQESGFFNTPFEVILADTNDPPALLYYTTDGSEPTTEDMLYTGESIPIYTRTIIRARAIMPGYIPSPTITRSYFFNVNHVTPIISVVTDPENLYGEQGMFDHPFLDWLKPCHVEYFDSTAAHSRLFSQPSGMIMDGGAGGSRGHPQRSFRLKLADGVLGANPVQLPIIPTMPDRLEYSDFYLRNGSNQWLVLPYKDAAQVRMMAEGTNNYYSGWRPVSVYINGNYFGMYELREKLNVEKFKLLDNATTSTIELLSQSYFYGGILRAVQGDVQNFYTSYDAIDALSTNSPDYWEQADAHVDMQYYADYIMGELWMGNVDWPYNNIKIYRSDATNFRWRFILQDLELAMLPNGWTDCEFNSIDWIYGQDYSPYTRIYTKSMQNERFRNYWINRFADLMNTSYRAERLLAIENHCFNQSIVEMHNEYQRWGNPWEVPAQINQFYQNHLTFRDQLSCRNEQVRSFMENRYDIEQRSITLDVFPAGAGQIKISTITPETYPWQGVYFDGIPLSIEAVANEGYSFVNWDENAVIADLQSALFEGMITLDNLNFTANFQEVVSVESVSRNAGFQAYPIPVEHELTVKLNDVYTVAGLELIDQFGRVILQKQAGELQSVIKLNMHSQPAGIYTLRVRYDSGDMAVRRIVKK